MGDMAARLNLKHADDVRLKIQTSQLVNRLQDFAFGKPDPKTGKPQELDPVRLKAIEILLRKSLPDLSSVRSKGCVTGRDDDLHGAVDVGVDKIGRAHV